MKSKKLDWNMLCSRAEGSCTSEAWQMLITKLVFLIWARPTRIVEHLLCWLNTRPHNVKKCKRSVVFFHMQNKWMLDNLRILNFPTVCSATYLMLWKYMATSIFQFVLHRQYNASAILVIWQMGYTFKPALTAGHTSARALVVVDSKL